MNEVVEKIKHIYYTFSLLGKGNVALGKGFWRGKSVQIEAIKGKILFGNYCSIRDFTSVKANKNASIIIGNHVFFNRNCTVCASENIRIDDNCIFGPNVCIYDHNHLFDYCGVKHDEYKTSPIYIMHDCWIGANVTVLKGVTIGECSIIGAGVVLKENVPPHSLVMQETQYIHIEAIREKK